MNNMNNMNNMNMNENENLDAKLAEFTASLPTSMPAGFIGRDLLGRLIDGHHIDERLGALVTECFRFKAETGGSAMANAEAVGAIIRHSVPDVGPLDTPERIASAHERLAPIREARKWAWIEVQVRTISEEDRDILAETVMHMIDDLGYRITFEYPKKDDPDLRLILRNMCRERERLACLQRFICSAELYHLLAELDKRARERILPLLADKDLADSIGQDLSDHHVSIPDDRFNEWWRPYW
mgnify:CR=1 FL=1